MFYRAWLEDQNQPRRLCKIQSVTLIGAKREARQSESGVLSGGLITLECWDGKSRTKLNEEFWQVVSILRVGRLWEDARFLG